MLNAIATLFKLALFTVLILVAGQNIHWERQSLAEHVGRGIHQLINSDWSQQLQSWITQLTQDAAKGGKKIAQLDELSLEASAPERKPQ